MTVPPLAVTVSKALFTPPAKWLARMLGIHIAVAAAWQRAGAGDWTDYAADLARRS
ncbi:hypothetical protein [Dactylosporangium darangshiense]|uniref:Uncharacterized protein n=1 Tax=Dactylosporangium darangshiense TaxID=579108 RepID=A0ABP8DI17_9ACTN